MIEILYILSWVVVTQVHKTVKTHPTVHLGSGHFNVHKLQYISIKYGFRF